MRVEIFDFHLPPDRIAHHPVQPRDAARLLHVAGGRTEDRAVADLPRLLRAGDLLVLNDTRVIAARLLGRRGVVPVELLLHRAAPEDAGSASSPWFVFAKPGKRLKIGHEIVFDEGLTAAVVDKTADGLVVVRFNRSPVDLIAVLARIGHVPLPPYIRRDDAPADHRDYQTVYAARDGAVAAPTAGLHFTPELFSALDAAGVRRAVVTLHVGAGTFLPVKVDDTDAHVMHAEWGEVGATAAALINETRARGGRIVAVGTTSLRLLETAARDDGSVAPFAGDTRLFITPGYRFKSADMLMTNFHLPRSTLYMLVCAFAGLDVMHEAYAHAIAARYRFYSYGDACLLERAPR
ncbi:MAG: tRNA preQ1(34) S-adenosylmethionine ribosyltransferase-isomerase QueA [Rhodospirillaceae bacterium]|nr:MAG: tRNA preQ1(34) S-adenosylmethionine ribosyltransferase-isomerase QueA [Rhodospirillaceae bacterium]